MNPTAYLGMYQGKHYSQYRDTIRGFLQTKDFHLAEKLLLDLIPIIEGSSLQSRRADVWDYYQMLAHIYFLIHETSNEYAVIERYLQLMVALGGIAHPEALQRRSQLQSLTSPSSLTTNTVVQKLPPFGQAPSIDRTLPPHLMPSPMVPVPYYPQMVKPTIVYQQVAAAPQKKSISCLSVLLSGFVLFVCIGGGLSMLGKSAPPSVSSPMSVASGKPTARPVRSIQTATPKPKPTATPIPLVGTMAKTGNFRNGPSTDADILQTLKAGTPLTLLTDLTLAESRWYRVKTDDGEGWVSASLVAVDPAIDDHVPHEPHSTKFFLIAPPQGAWCTTSDEVRVCAFDFRYVNRAGYSYAPEGAHYIAFGMSVTNATNHDIVVSASDLSVVMQGNQTYSYASETFSYWSSPLEVVTVAPGDSVTGGIVFLVPNTIPMERIIYRGLLLDSVTLDLRDAPIQ